MGIWALDLTDLVINIIIVIRLQLKMQNIKMCTCFWLDGYCTALSVLPFAVLCCSPLEPENIAIIVRI
jgi:hypothetical protein